MMSPNWYSDWQEQLHLKFKSLYEQYYENNSAGMSFTSGPTLVHFLILMIGSVM